MYLDKTRKTISEELEFNNEFQSFLFISMSTQIIQHFYYCFYGDVSKGSSWQGPIVKLRNISLLGIQILFLIGRFYCCILFHLGVKVHPYVKYWIKMHRKPFTANLIMVPSCQVGSSSTFFRKKWKVSEVPHPKPLHHREPPRHHMCTISRV